MLPGDAVWHAAHWFARWRFCGHVKREVGRYWFRTVDPGAPMSRELRLMTRALDRQALEQPFSDHYFHYEAYKEAFCFLRAAEQFSFNLRTTGAILEFGCGSARLLRLFRCIDGVRLAGTDVNPACIQWCRENVPGPEYYVNDLKPPLEFAEEGSFDLVFANSVFTHIPLDLQRPWLEEIRRILRPGGIFLCTVLGWNYQATMLTAQDRERLAREGELTLTAADPKASLSTQTTGSWDVFQRRERVIERFGSVFDLLDYLPAVQTPLGQDLLVLRKNDLSGPAERLPRA